MTMDNASGSRIKTDLYVTSAFILFALIYFTPVHTLQGFLPEILVKYRISAPLLILTIAGAFLLPLRITLAMAFSFAGDTMGAYGSFIGQMGFFALAHVMLISFFIRRLIFYNVNGTNPVKLNGIPFIIRSSAITLFLLLFGLTAIVPHAPAGLIRTGCAIYTILICTMFFTARLQKSMTVWTGAALFLISDMILSWNMFVYPVEHSSLFIMIPYYSGQLLLWIGTRHFEKFVR